MNTPDKIYYVYVYLDPTHTGSYVYGSYKFQYEPFYVGMGKRNRMYFHLNEAMYKSHVRIGNKHKFYRIKSILSQGMRPIVEKLYDGLTEKEALLKEIEVINCIGRRTTKSGPLTNLSKGGDAGPQLLGKDNPMFGLTGSLHPSSQWVRPEWYLEKLSASHQREKNSMWGKFWTDEQKISHSQKIKSKLASLTPEEFKQKHCRPCSEEQKKKLRVSMGGKNHPRYGKPCPPDIAMAISKALKGRFSGVKNPNVKSWKVIDPSGNEVIIKSLHTFCRERGMCADSLKLAGKENRQVNDGPSKGWSAQRFTEST